MNYVSILEPASEQFIRMVARKGSIPTAHSQEDYFAVSKRQPIFVVADGVTLAQYVVEGKKYPNPSPAGEAAKIFCEQALAAAEARYASFEEKDIEEVFRIANSAVAEYNRAHGRTKDIIDYWDTDFYAATAALAVIKENMVYWGSICDSYVMHFDHAGALRFKSPNCDALAQGEAPPFTGNPNDEKARIRYTWQVRRNGVNREGQPIGYGVVTGEPEALLYLSSGSFPVRRGDFVSVLTDGFEWYMKLPEFLKLFVEWPNDLKNQIAHFTAKKSAEDPEQFGHERTLIMVSI